MAEDESFNNCMTLLWRIDNIGVHLRTTLDDFGIQCPKFRSRTFEGKEFRIALHLTDKKDDFGIRVGMSSRPFKFPVDFEFSILGITGSPLFVRTLRNFVRQESEYVECPDCPTYEEVFGESGFVQRDSLAVRVRVWSSTGDALQNEFISCRSRIECMEDSFLFPIPGFSSLELNREVSMPLTFDFSDGLDNFLLNFRLDGESLENAIAKVQLLAVSISRDFDMHMKVSVLDEEANWVKSIEKSCRYFESGSAFSCTFEELISREELMRGTPEFFRDDVLFLHCKISAKQFTNFFDKNYFGVSDRIFDPSKDVFRLSDASCQALESDIDHPEASLETTASTASLVDDLYRLYTTGSQSDYKLQTGDESFLVHKMVLSARSPFFRDMLSQSNNTEHLDVFDLDASTLNLLLIYLYTGTLEPNLRWEDALKLYKAADKCKVQPLKDWCFSIFRADVSELNVIDVLKAATEYNDNDLIVFVYDFIIDRMDEIVQSEEWEHFVLNDSDFAAATMQAIVERKNSVK